MLARLKLVLFMCVLFAAAPVYSSGLSVYPDSKELAINVAYGKDQGEGKLIIANNSAADIVTDIRASELRHTDSKFTAGLELILKGESGAYHKFIVGKSERIELIVRAKNVDVFGEFTGKIEISGAQPVSVKVKKTAGPVEFPGITDNRLELAMDRPDRRNFEITLKNPEGGVYRSLTIQNLTLRSDGKIITGAVEPVSPLMLEPGESKRLRISFSDIPKGKYRGIFTVKDDYTDQEVLVELDAPYMTLNSVADGNMLLVFGLVFVGALLSLIVTKAAPITAKKRGNRGRILDLKAEIKTFIDDEQGLKIKFMVELLRAATLNDNTKIFTPSAEERFNSVTGILDKLDRDITLMKEINKRYIEINSTDRLPITVEEGIRSKLNYACLSLYLEDFETAEKTFKEAEQMFQIDRGFCGIIEDNIKEFLKERRTLDDYGSNLIDKLKEILPELERLKLKPEEQDETEETECIEKLRVWDLTREKANIYCNKFHIEVPEDFRKEYREKIVSLLNSEEHKDILEAAELCDSLKLGVTEKTLATAVTDRKCRIAHNPPDADVDKVIEFTLTFDDDALNKSPLRRRFRYLWDFGDMTLKQEGIKVKHYFKRRWKLILFRKWFRRNIMMLFCRNKIVWKEFKVSVEISPVNSGSVHGPRCTLPVKESLERSYRAGVTFIDVLGFVITFILSCIVAATSIYDETFSFKSIKDILSPVLLGFSLDISREKLLSSVKEKVGKG